MWLLSLKWSLPSGPHWSTFRSQEQIIFNFPSVGEKREPKSMLSDSSDNEFSELRDLCFEAIPDITFAVSICGEAMQTLLKAYQSLRCRGC